MYSVVLKFDIVVILKESVIVAIILHRIVISRINNTYISITSMKITSYDYFVGWELCRTNILSDGVLDVQWEYIFAISTNNIQ